MKTEEILAIVSWLIPIILLIFMITKETITTLFWLTIFVIPMILMIKFLLWWRKQETFSLTLSIKIHGADQEVEIFKNVSLYFY